MIPAPASARRPVATALSTSGASQTELIATMRELNTTIAALPADHPYVFHPGKFLFLNYLKGIVYGLGLLTAFAIIVPIMVAMLRQVSWVPLVGDFVKDVATRVEQQNSRR